MGMEFFDHDTGYRVAKSLFSQQVLVGGTLTNSQVIRIEPPYAISYRQIDYVLNALDETLSSFGL